jgi:hypothetical protein
MKKFLALFVLFLPACSGHYVMTQSPSPAYGPAWSQENINRYLSDRNDPQGIREKAAQRPTTIGTYRYYYDDVPYGYARRCTTIERWHTNRKITSAVCEIVKVNW